MFYGLVAANMDQSFWLHWNI